MEYVLKNLGPPRCLQSVKELLCPALMIMIEQYFDEERDRLYLDDDGLAVLFGESAR